MTTLVVGGAIANKLLNGGEAWVRLSWIRGFQRLGFEVHFLEQIDPGASLEDARAYFDRVMEQFGLTGSATLIVGDRETASGLSGEEALELAAEADLLVNISGNVRSQELLSRFTRRAYVDLDPGFTQFWHADGTGGARLDGHDVHFTVGENIGRPDCPIPTCGLEWKAVRAPAVFEDWPVAEGGDTDRFTTIGAWRGPFGPVHFGGHTYSLKVHEFRKVIELPRRSPQRFEIALDIHPGDERDREALEANGWRLVDPRATVPGPLEFREYVQGSGAEFSVAQGIYVETNSGWFSDRTVRYLASGRPVLVQDTGFSANLPVGEGLLTFTDLDGAVKGAERIAADYEHHRRAARAVAEAHFDSDTVLSRFLEEAGIRP
jgi:hypothetical protein